MKKYIIFAKTFDNKTYLMEQNTRLDHLICCHFTFDNLLKASRSYSDAIDMMKKFHSRKKYGKHDIFSTIKSIYIKKLSSIIEMNVNSKIIPNHKNEKVHSPSLLKTKWQNFSQK